jgi:hypothetical protein
MPLKRDISDDTRIIDLTIGELVAVLRERLGSAPPSERSRPEPEALLDTWAAATLLGVGPKQDPGPEPPRGSSAWRGWRELSQAVRDDVAHRFQQLLIRRPELATLARYEGRRRYFVRADLLRYLDSLAPKARRRHR